MKNTNQKLKVITPNTLIVGVDVSKTTHWARFINYRGMELGKILKFLNDKNGFENILSTIRKICNDKHLDNVIIGMEPTGHYWKPLANYLIMNEKKVVMINPYHTKRAKELDDNSQTKNDKKDALTIAKLLSNGRFYEIYMPQDIFAELRILSNARVSLMRRYNATQNTITSILDEYFPEIKTVFKALLKERHQCRY